jgi:ubiquinone/menaquinone biosynthesis C-methylase UbiE
MIKINIGCGGRPLKDYINVDMDTLEEIRARYPFLNFDDEIRVEQYDIFNLPFENNSVDEIRAEGLIEHLPFVDEPKFFKEVIRVLKQGGTLYISTVDFEMAVKQWLDAKDDWQDFYRNDKESILNNHWFGTYTYSPINRWGYLTATLFGSQNGSGQFHTNCYTEAKLRAICSKLHLKVDSIDRFQWKSDRDYMLGLKATKI